jgi:hypothetical protein
LPDRADVGDEQVEAAGSEARDHQLAQEHDHAAHSADHCVPQGIGPGEFEAVLGGVAEVLAADGDLDVGLRVDELDDALHAGEEALEALDDVLEALVALSLRLRLPLHHLHHHLQELHDRQEQGAEGQTAEVESEYF